MSNNDWGTDWQESTRRRLVIFVLYFCGLFATLEIKIFEIVGLHKPSKVPPSVEVIMLIGLIFVSPLVALAFTRIFRIITDRTEASITKQDHRQELAIALLMLRERTRKNLLGKSSLCTVSFLSAMLWLIGAANHSAILVSFFAAFFLLASITDDVLLARRIMDGSFAESESDARDLLLFISHADNMNIDDFTRRPLIPDDQIPNLTKSIEGVEGLPNS